MPQEYIVRLWVDLKVKADNESHAKDIARHGSYDLTLDSQDSRLIVYDTQVSGQVWPHEVLGWGSRK